jgi:hypothetical protein
MLVQPNPASDLVHVSVGQKIDGQVQWSLIGSDGRVAMRKIINGLATGQVVTLDVQHLPAGLYMLQLESASFRSNAKVVIR